MDFTKGENVMQVSVWLRVYFSELFLSYSEKKEKDVVSKLEKIDILYKNLKDIILGKEK